MKFSTCAAALLVTAYLAAPTPSFANDEYNNVMNYYNERNSAASQPRSRNQRAAPRGARVTRNEPRPRATVFGSAATGSPHWINVARRHMGTNPTGRRSLWCADFMNLVLRQSGLQGTSSSMARSFASYGQRLSGPRVGAIAVLSRGRNGGHVGIVTGVDASGNPTLISGNHNNRVAEATYPRGRVIAYVWPTS